jgi:uncharacterized Zn-finger protein
MVKSLKGLYTLIRRDAMDETLMNSEIEYIETEKTVVKCDGGGGPLGHPAVYLNLGKENKGVCPYCNKCFVKDVGHSTTEKKTKGLRRVS